MTHRQKRQLSRQTWICLRQQREKNPNLILGNSFIKLKKYENRKRKARHSKNGQKSKRNEINNIVFDKKINFGDDIGSIISIKSKVNQYIKFHKQFNIRLDHSKIEEVSIGGLLYLVAQISKISKTIGNYKKRTLGYNQKLGINSKNNKLKYLFYKIGYWQYFGINHKPYDIKNDEDNSHFLSIESSTEKDIPLLNKIKKFVKKETNFFNGDYQLEYQFDDIVKEAMGNATEHAYDVDFKQPGKEKDKWWVCGHYDKSASSLDIVFYDYGIGIRQSIKNNLGEKADRKIKDQIADLLVRTDADLIEIAINGELSKYKYYTKQDRGKGFKRFQTFAKTCGYDCELVIVSNKGKYKFSYNNKDNHEKVTKTKLDEDIEGMFIKWKIKL